MQVEPRRAAGPFWPVRALLLGLLLGMFMAWTPDWVPCALADNGTCPEETPSGCDATCFNHTLTITVENDFFGGGTDEHYTNGLRVAYVSCDLNEFRCVLPDWLLEYVDILPFLGGTDRQHNVSLAIDHEIYTPEDTQTEWLMEHDRPYAALAAFTLGFVSKDAGVLDVVENTIGVVGPSALGEDIQNSFHQLINDDTAKGWDNQLHDEPALMLSWQRVWRSLDLDFGEDTGFGMDLLPHVGATAGNVFTGVQAGAEMRIGYNLPVDFGTGLMNKGAGVTAPLDPSDPADDTDPRLNRGIGLHFFGGVDGHWVVRNIFLDGNTFEHSHNVDKHPFVADVYGGASLILGGVKLTYTLVHRSDEFKGQSGGQTYGSLNLTIVF